MWDTSIFTSETMCVYLSWQIAIPCWSFLAIPSPFSLKWIRDTLFVISTTLLIHFTGNYTVIVRDGVCNFCSYVEWFSYSLLLSSSGILRQKPEKKHDSFLFPCSVSSFLAWRISDTLYEHNIAGIRDTNVVTKITYFCFSDDLSQYSSLFPKDTTDINCASGEREEFNLMLSHVCYGYPEPNQTISRHKSLPIENNAKMVRKVIDQLFSVCSCYASNCRRKV